MKKNTLNRIKHSVPIKQQILMGAATIVCFLIFGFFAFFFLLVFVIVQKLFFSQESHFLRLEKKLPTSPIGSIQPGLVEVNGKLKTITSFPAPMDSTSCIGFKYTIEEVRRDNEDNRTTHFLINQVTQCNNFFIEDETGKVEVDNNKLEILWKKIDLRQDNRKERHTQYLLKENDEMLLIGRAYSENGKTIIKHDPENNVFMITPTGAIHKWNEYKPVLKNLILTMTGIAIISIFILMATISIDTNIVYIFPKTFLFEANSPFISFRIPEWLNSFIEEPVLITTWAAFGLFIAILIIGMLVALIEKIIHTKIFTNFFSLFTGGLAITWLAGFITMVLFLFTGVSGIKMCLVWITLFTGSNIFSVIEYKKINKYLNVDKNK